MHHLGQTLHGPGGVLAVKVPDESSALHCGLQLGEYLVSVLLPRPALALATTTQEVQTSHTANILLQVGERELPDYDGGVLLVLEVSYL